MPRRFSQFAGAGAQCSPVVSHAQPVAAERGGGSSRHYTAAQCRRVTQGLARLFRFPSNILAVFFSDVAVMDARAVNARTVAITGLRRALRRWPCSQNAIPGDAVGRSHIYQIAVRPPASSAATPAPVVPQRNPADVETAIRVALDDPRVGVSVHPDARPQSGCAFDWFGAQRG
jgi:hypothetical protein